MYWSQYGLLRDTTCHRCPLGHGAIDHYWMQPSNHFYWTYQFREKDVEDCVKGLTEVHTEQTALPLSTDVVGLKILFKCAIQPIYIINLMQYYIVIFTDWYSDKAIIPCSWADAVMSPTLTDSLTIITSSPPMASYRFLIFTSKDQCFIIASTQDNYLSISDFISPTLSSLCFFPTIMHWTHFLPSLTSHPCLTKVRQTSLLILSTNLSCLLHWTQEEKNRIKPQQLDRLWCLPTIVLLPSSVLPCVWTVLSISDTTPKGQLNPTHQMLGNAGMHCCSQALQCCPALIPVPGRSVKKTSFCHPKSFNTE